MSTFEPPDESSTIPPSVYEDLRGNEGLMERWVTDEQFRAGILDAEDPAGFAHENGEFDLQPETSDWIKERVAALTPEERERLLHPPRYSLT